MFSQTQQIKRLLMHLPDFIQQASGLTLRRYQTPVAMAIADSVIRRRGLSFVVIFPRQSGKNELQAQIEAYLLTLFSRAGGEIVKVSPTWKPQTQNAMRRLERVLQRNLITRHLFCKEAGYIFRIGNARILFFSGSPTANIVGATASLLLEVDEAQDVTIEKFDKDIAPMAAATNATRVFWGTPWTAQTLLAREARLARQAEARDGVQRLFQLDAAQVSAEVPAYAEFVAEQVARLGRDNPMIRTQYFCEEIEAQGGLFPPLRLALLQGNHAAQTAPMAGRTYAFTLDVAGGDEARSPWEGGRPVSLQGSAGGGGREGDASALTIWEVDLSTLDEAGVGRPTYRIVNRRLWRGVAHPRLYAELRGLIETWAPRRLVMDATGIGASLAAFLSQAFPGLVVPFVFSQASKSKLGWDFVALIETGRVKDHAAAGEGETAGLQALFRLQAAACEAEILPGPARTLRWGVPDGRRTPSGEPLHDDLLTSAALAAVFDHLAWGAAASQVVSAADPLSGQCF